MWYIIAIPIGLIILWRFSRWEENKYIERLGRQQKSEEMLKKHPELRERE